MNAYILMITSTMSSLSSQVNIRANCNDDDHYQFSKMDFLNILYLAEDYINTTHTHTHTKTCTVVSIQVSLLINRHINVFLDIII